MPRLLRTFCDGSELYLKVEVGLVVAGGPAGVWNVGVWDSSLWGLSETWTDVSDYVENVSVSRGFSRDLRIWSAGKATVTLTNQDGRFSPDNLSGPYVVAGVSSISPGCGIRISLTYRGTEYWLFRGYVDEWGEEWVSVYGPRTGGAESRLSCVDTWSRITRSGIAEVSPAVGTGDTFGVRINRILNEAEITVPRAIDAGSTTMQGTTFSSSPEELITVTCDSEGGAVYAGADGTIIGKRKYSLVEDSTSVNVQATFGDGGGAEIPWSSIDLAPYNMSNTINFGAYTRVGGNQQVYRDEESIARYGIYEDKTPNIGSLVCETDAQALSLAQWAVISHRIPEAAINGITVNPLCDPDTLASILALQVRYLVEVIRRPPSATGHTVTRSLFISGINTTISGGDLTVGFAFYPATSYRLFSESRWNVGVWDESLWFT